MITKETFGLLIELLLMLTDILIELTNDIISNCTE